MAKNRKLGRTTDQREALLRSQVTSLLVNGQIETTLAKAKELRRFVEPILTSSKDDSMSSRRLVFSKLMNKEAVKELFNNISSVISDRKGGYTRIIKTGNRYGDNAKMCLIELVDYGYSAKNNSVKK